MKVHHPNCGGARGYAIGCRCPDVQFTSADAQALADVRTLDSYAEAAGAGALTHPYPCHGEWYIDDDTRGAFFKGPTPDAARAAAAAWVREQGK